MTKQSLKSLKNDLRIYTVGMWVNFILSLFGLRNVILGNFPNGLFAYVNIALVWLLVNRTIPRTEAKIRKMEEVEET